MTDRMDPAPAPLRARLAAVGHDYLVVLAYVTALVIVGVVASSALSGLFDDPIRGEIIGFVVLTLPVTLYFVLGEASASGATWGKRRMGLRVVTRTGDRLSLVRSLVRSGTKFLPWELAHAAIWQFSAGGRGSEALPTVLLASSWILVGLNVLAAIVDRRHRALHDFIAGTRVIATHDSGPRNS
jgi:uncharacterized RDD family membrane protein YckC